MHEAENAVDRRVRKTTSKQSIPYPARGVDITGVHEEGDTVIITFTVLYKSGHEVVTRADFQIPQGYRYVCPYQYTTLLFLVGVEVLFEEILADDAE